MPKVLFKGFKQVNATEWAATSDANKKQYMWFVRPDGATDGTKGDLYFGTRHYGHVNEAELDALKQILTSVGLNPTTGEYVPYSAGTYTSAATTVLAATSALDDAVKANKVYEANGITVTNNATGTTVAVKVKDGDSVLATDASGLSATLRLVKIADPAAEFASQYKLVGKDGVTALGTTIDIVKDQFLKKVAYVEKMTAEIIAEYHLPGTVEGYTKNPYLCFLWELDTDPSTAGDQVGTAIPLGEIFEDFTLVFKLNGEQFIKNEQNEYELTIDATEIDTVADITPDDTAVVGATIAAGSSIEEALGAIYSSSLLYIEGSDVES